MAEIQTVRIEEPSFEVSEIDIFDSVNYLQLFNDFFGFKEHPFTNTPDPDFFYMSHQHHEALMSMMFGVQQRRGFIVVTGEVGSGKTTLCRKFLRQINPEIKTAVILNPKVSGLHLLTSIIHDFGIPFQGKSKKDIFEALNKFLLDGMPKNQNACLIIDEAQCLSPKVIEEIRLLSNLETSKRKLLQIVLMGQPELRDVLKKPNLRQLRQRIGVYVHLKGFDLFQTGEYIRHRLGLANQGSATLEFDSELVSHIYKCSGGSPRLVNTICDRILMAAFIRKVRNKIDMAVAQEAFDEINFICGLNP